MYNELVKLVKLAQDVLQLAWDMAEDPQLQADIEQIQKDIEALLALTETLRDNDARLDLPDGF